MHNSYRMGANGNNTARLQAALQVSRNIHLMACLESKALEAQLGRNRGSEVLFVDLPSLYTFRAGARRKSIGHRQVHDLQKQPLAEFT